MELQFRLMKSDEFGLALLMLTEAAQHLKDKGVNQWSHWLQPGEDQVAWIKEGFAKREFYAVENRDSVIIAMFRLMQEDLLYWGAQKDEARYVHSLVVKRDFAGMQLGTRILEQIGSDLIKAGVSKFRLDCNAANAWLCKYYEQQGFTKVGMVQMTHSLNNLYEKALK